MKALHCSDNLRSNCLRIPKRRNKYYIVQGMRAKQKCFYIPLLPFPVSRILLLKNPAFAPPVMSQNPFALLAPRRDCLLSICLNDRWHSQPLSSVSRKQRYNTLDFPAENRVPTGMLLAPIGNPAPRSCAPLDTPRFSHL